MKLAVLELDWTGGLEVMVTTGLVMSTVQVQRAGAPVFPARSVAWTETVWVPSETQ